MSFLKSYWEDRAGAQMIEYAIIISLIVVGLIIAVTAIGNSSKSMFENLDQQWDAAAGSDS